MTADDLLILARTYGQALDIALSGVGTKVCGNSHLFVRLAKGAGCNSRTAERAASWFLEHWPSGLAWPDGVARPDGSVRPGAEDRAA